MLAELQRIAAQQAVKYQPSCSDSDLDDLRQEGVMQMIEVMLRKQQPEEPGAYLTAVCRNAMLRWFKTYKGGAESVPFDEEVHGAWDSDPEEQIDRARARERKMLVMASMKKASS